MRMMMCLAEFLKMEVMELMWFVQSMSAFQLSLHQMVELELQEERKFTWDFGYR